MTADKNSRKGLVHECQFNLASEIAAKAHFPLHHFVAAGEKL